MKWGQRCEAPPFPGQFSHPSWRKVVEYRRQGPHVPTMPWPDVTASEHGASLD